MYIQILSEYANVPMFYVGLPSTNDILYVISLCIMVEPCGLSRYNYRMNNCIRKYLALWYELVDVKTKERDINYNSRGLLR